MLMGIDPGRNKVGIAILDDNNNVVFKDIIKTAALSNSLVEIIKKYEIDKYILGNGTYADKIFNILNILTDQNNIIFIDEENTTYLAESRYRKENPPLGLSFLNKIIQFKPKKALDDYVAVILVEKYLKRLNE